MRIFLIITCLLIQACNTDGVVNERKDILVSGQSNAARCDWSYFESISDYDVVNISVGGYTIDELINEALDDQYQNLPSKMIFVHGESDAKYAHQGSRYVGKVNDYINILGVSDVYISLVGYRVVDGMYGNADQAEMNERFDDIRNATEFEIKSNSVWKLGFSDAKYFVDWGLLSDHIHFNQEGCEMMMESINQSLIEEG